MIQTNRTLLIEEIAPDKDNIISIIRYMEQRESLSDEEIEEIHKKLEVSSFDEVIQKFKPQVYMSLDTDNMEAAFYKKIPLEMTASFEAIPLCKNMAFFDEVLELIENKRKRKYVLTSFQDFCKALLVTPEPEMFWKMREELIYLVKTGDEESAVKQLAKLIEQYDEGIFLLKTFLQETYIYIEGAISESDDLCFVIDDEGTQVHPLQISEHFEHSRYHTKEEEDMYFEFLNKYIEDNSINNRNLMILLLELCCKPRRNNLELLERYYREYLEFYGKVLQRFWWETKPLLETLLGIKNFFGNYKCQEGSMSPTMVITNCTPEFLANNRYIETFRLYLETINEKNYFDKAIWYAIVPRIPFKGSRREKVRERFLSSKTPYVYQTNALEGVQVVIEILGKYKIQTFLSIIAGNDTDFNALKSNGIDEFEDSFSFLQNAEYKEYMIPSYPNFTIIPQEYTLIMLGKKQGMMLLKTKYIFKMINVYGWMNL